MSSDQQARELGRIKQELSQLNQSQKEIAEHLDEIAEHLGTLASVAQGEADGHYGTEFQVSKSAEEDE